MAENNLSNLDMGELDNIAGGGREKEWARIKCPKCGNEFTFEYQSVVSCPSCWSQIPVWQGVPGIKKVDGPDAE